MRLLTISGLAFITLVVACLGASERRVLIIPLDAFEQKVSEKMREHISALEAKGTLSALSSWTAIAELPAWVFVGKKREIAFIFGRPGASDDYRYAVILGRRKQPLIVRAGGIAGSYEIFVKPKA